MSIPSHMCVVVITRYCSVVASYQENLSSKKGSPTLSTRWGSGREFIEAFSSFVGAMQRSERKEEPREGVARFAQPNFLLAHTDAIRQRLYNSTLYHNVSDNFLLSLQQLPPFYQNQTMICKIEISLFSG